MKARPRLLLLVTEDWYFWSHRLDLARAARDAGIEVLVATRVQHHGELIAGEGFKLFPIRLLRQSRDPLRELVSIIELVNLYRHERPHIVHHIAMKPVLYGSWAARLSRVPAVVNTFAGLGFTFISNDQQVRLFRSAIGRALRWALALPRARVIFQNGEDREQLVRAGIVRENQAVIIRGSGVNISKFVPRPEENGDFLVVLPARMLWDKGVGEFVEAAKLLHEWGVRAKCVLVGRLDKQNPASIPESQLDEWQKDGVVEWWGHQEDMPGVLASAHIVILPSYREGLPRVLLEAAACARPIVATDVPGCREIVRHGDNGFLVPPKNPQALARAIAVLVQDPALRARMGARGRAMVESCFTAEQVARETLAVYQELLGKSWSTSCASN